MKVTSLAPWYGAKRTLAPRILNYFGDHSVYWEPFCGSMAMLLAKPPVRQETVNDLHRDLTNLAFVIQDPKLACEFDWRLRRTLCAEGLFRASLEWLRDEKNALGIEVNPERAYHYFVTSWLGMNGICGTDRVTSSFAKRFTSGGGDGGTRFASAVDSIPAWHSRLRTVMIYNGSGSIDASDLNQLFARLRLVPSRFQAVGFEPRKTTSGKVLDALTLHSFFEWHVYRLGKTDVDESRYRNTLSNLLINWARYEAQMPFLENTHYTK